MIVGKMAMALAVIVLVAGCGKSAARKHCEETVGNMGATASAFTGQEPNQQLKDAMKSTMKKCEQL